MGFISRRVVPRKVRRAAHPVRALKRRVTPRSIKRIRRALSPLGNARYGITRALMTPSAPRPKPPSLWKIVESTPWQHDGCTVDHRSTRSLQSCPVFKRAVREAVKSDPEYQAARAARDAEFAERSRALREHLQRKADERRARESDGRP